MSGIEASSIEKLNSKIEGLMKKRASVEAEKQVLRRSLYEMLGQYKESYGVDLASEDLSQVEKAIGSEYEKVSSSLEKEYAIANKVVTLIEEGKVEEARRVLGQGIQKTKVEEEDGEKQDNPVAKEEVKEQEKVTEPKADDRTKEEEPSIFSNPMTSKVKESKSVTIPAEKEVTAKEEVINDEEEDIPVTMKSAPNFGDFDFEDDDDDEVEFSPKVNEEPKAPENAFPEDDEFGGFEFDDDDDMDFGFKDLLHGSQFES